MKIYKNDNDTVRVGCTEKDGKYLIVVEKEKKMLVATRHSKMLHVETYYTHFEKSFENKDLANKYFLGIKKNNPTLKLYVESPWKVVW